jgi:hypothetical protein
MSPPTTGERARRKSLSEELDRLDEILDVLAAGLPQAVAEAARAGTREAVGEVLTEVLTRPEFRRRPDRCPPAPGSGPRPRADPWRRVRPAFAALKGRVRRVFDTVRAPWGRVPVLLAAGCHFAECPLPLRRVLFVALGCGLIGAGVAVLAPAAVAAPVSGAGLACTALAVQIVLWLGRGTNGAELRLEPAPEPEPGGAAPDPGP